MKNYELVQITINTLGLNKIIIHAVVYYQSLSDSIVSNQKSVFTSKFYFFSANFLVSSVAFMLSSIRKLTVRQNNRIIP